MPEGRGTGRRPRLIIPSVTRENSKVGQEFRGRETSRTAGPSVALSATFGRVLIMTEDRPLIEHAHEEVQVIFHLDGTRTRWTVGDVLAETRPGDMLLLDPWERHSKVGTSDKRILLMSVLVRPDRLLRQDPQCSPNAASRALPASARALGDVAHAACTALLDGEDEPALKARFELLIDGLPLGRGRGIAAEPAPPLRRTLKHILAAQPGELQIADLPRFRRHEPIAFLPSVPQTGRCNAASGHRCRAHPSRGAPLVPRWRLDRRHRFRLGLQHLRTLQPIFHRTSGDIARRVPPSRARVGRGALAARRVECKVFSWREDRWTMPPRHWRFSRSRRRPLRESDAARAHF